MGLLRLIVRALFGSFRRKRRRSAIRYRPARRSEPILQAHHPAQYLHNGIPPALTGLCWVIDGDTIDISGTRIRLAGIDAPEMEQPYGKSAKWALAKLCKGQMITAVFEADITYERLVATCYLPDGRDLSAEMVSAGMAIDWKKFSGGKYRALELPDARQRLWRCVARQQGRMPQTLPD